MTPQHECAFYRTARFRWPSFTVHGTGPYAVVNQPSGMVSLFSFRFGAEDYLNQRTGRGDAEYCTLLKLPPTWTTPTTGLLERNPSDRERERHA